MRTAALTVGVGACLRTPEAYALRQAVGALRHRKYRGGVNAGLQIPTRLVVPLYVVKNNKIKENSDFRQILPPNSPPWGQIAQSGRSESLRMAKVGPTRPTVATRKNNKCRFLYKVRHELDTQFLSAGKMS